MKLIGKDKVVAEIKRLIDRSEYSEVYDYAFRDGINAVCVHILSFLNTLEVKEVDLDESLSNLDKSIKEFVTTEEFEKDSAVYGHYWAIAKHAFLLGLKTKK